MPGFTTSMHIDAPVDEVFAAFTDFATAHERISAVERSEVVGDGPVQAGTRIRETRRMGGKSHTEEFEITAFEPGSTCTFESESCGAHYVFGFHFQPEDGGTRVESSFDARPQTFMARVMGLLMGPLMRNMCRKAVEKDMAELKAHLEGERPGEAASDGFATA